MTAPSARAGRQGQGFSRQKLPALSCLSTSWGTTHTLPLEISFSVLHYFQKLFNVWEAFLFLFLSTRA